MRMRLLTLCCLALSCTGAVSDLPEVVDSGQNVPVNTAPTVTVDGPASIRLPVAKATIHATAADADLDTLSFAWVVTPNPAALQLTGADTADLTLAGLTVGTFSITVTVTDGHGGQAQATHSLNVVPANQAPLVNGGGDKNLTLPTSTVQLTGTASDADGQVVSTVWSKTFGDDAVVMSGANSLTLSLSGLIEGHYLFRLTATDNDGQTASDEVSINVSATANQPPTVTVVTPVQVQLPTSTVTLMATASDADGSIATYQWSQVSGPGATLGRSDQASLMLSNLQAGTAMFRVRVTDNRGATATADATVTVLPSANAAPTVNAGADQRITLPTNTVTLTATASDSDGTIATWAWSQVTGPTATLSGATTSTVSLSTLSAGTSVFRITVTDNQGATASDDVSVIVSPAVTLDAGTDAGPVDAGGSADAGSGGTADAGTDAGSSLPSDGGEVNAVLGRPAKSASDYDVAAHPPSMAVDGDPNTYWVSNYPLVEGHFLMVRLQGTFDLTRWEIEGSHNPSGPANDSWELQSWNGCWQTIAGSQVSGNTQNSRSGTFTAPVRTDRVRLYCKSTTELCRIRELRVFGRPTSAAMPAISCPAGTQSVWRSPGHDFALFLPRDYNVDRTRTWPLILALHGLGGHTLTVDRTAIANPQEGLSYQFANQTFRDGFQAIVVSPNAKAPFTDSGTGYFNWSALQRMGDTFADDYLVDTDRISITGLSGGANIPWGELPADNSRYAAFAPMATTSTPANMANLCLLKKMPIWGFQGQNDGPSQIEGAKMALDACAPATEASAMQTTIVPGAGHSGATWDTAYANPALYTWLLSKKRSDRP